MSKEINSLRAEMAEDDPFLLAQICHINMSIDSYGSFLLTWVKDTAVKEVDFVCENSKDASLLWNQNV